MGKFQRDGVGVHMGFPKCADTILTQVELNWFKMKFCSRSHLCSRQSEQIGDTTGILCSSGKHYGNNHSQNRFAQLVQEIKIKTQIKDFVLEFFLNFILDF